MRAAALWIGCAMGVAGAGSGWAEPPPMGVPIPAQAWDYSAQVSAGRAYFAGTCAVCHQHDGAGIPGVFPPISNNEFLKKSKEELIQLVLTGVSGRIVVNGVSYNSTMPPLGGLRDEELANVLTYVYASWGNSPVQVLPGEVAAARMKLPRRGE